jgi:5'-nucleotidase
MSPIARRRPVVAGLATFGVVLASLAMVSVASPPAQANPAGTDLVITEVYVNGGSAGATHINKFIEIYNPTANPIALGGKSIQYRSPTGSGSSSATVALTAGDLAPGDYWVLQGNSNGANGTPTPNVDQVSSITPGAGGGTLSLVNATTAVDPSTAVACDVTPGAGCMIDKVGWGTSNTPEGTAASGNSVILSLQRVNSGLDTNANSVDFAAATPTAGLPKVGAVALDATNPGNKTGTVGQLITPFNMAATGGTSPYTWTDPDTTLPPGLSLASNGAISGTPTTANAYNVTLTVTDSVLPNGATDTVSFTYTISAAPAGVTPISDIQGTTDTSPMVGQTVTTEGVVTATYPSGAGSLNGIYIQTAGSGGSTNETSGASDAIFVFGNNSQPAGVEIGDSVEVTGVVSEFNGLTEITPGPSGVVEVGSLGTVTPRATVPGTDCALPGSACLTGAALNDAREAFEGELFQPTADYTVTDVNDGSAYNGGTFSSNFFGEIGLAANSDIPLVTPTEIIDAQATADINARKAYNDAHRLVLDDGAGVTYWNTSDTGAMDQPFPWFTETSYVRVGAAATFPQPVVLEFRNSTWKLQPQTKVTDGGADRVAFEQDRPATPEDVGGDLKLAAFNVLNYFTTLGVNVAGCSSFKDRLGNPIAVNSCPGNGPRGAWDQASFDRQESKIVESINTMDADIMALEEIENSGQVDGGDRDEAVQTLVAALNADAGSTRWAFVDSPAVVDAGEDVIRSTFIYNPNTVELVGDSELFYDPAFSDAREPFAQTFKALGADDADGFAMIANHFKSKGSGTPDPNGQGSANDRRILQATALVGFADDFAAAHGVDKVFLSGDFNAYSKEDPVQILEAAGYTSLESTSDPDEETYNFDGAIGSLDHIFANEAAEVDVAGVDIWTTNGYESQYYEYSRFNYNIRPLYAEGPFRASDHNPEIIGINVEDPAPATVDIQILGTNDFHGRLVREGSSPTAGAAVLSGAVQQLRAANPNTAFVAAGDLIGASTFESFIAQDVPTIDSLNAAGLDVSAAGNHEFDKGYDDLVDRVEPLADWEYIAANIRNNGDNTHALAPTWTQTFGSVKVGYIGAVTEDLPELVSPAGISEIHVTDIVTEANDAADDLKADGADVIVLLVHEGAPSTSCATMTNPATEFGSIVNGVNANIDAIVSGHTHLAYDCAIDVPAWSGRDVTERPVVSAGQYGMALNKIVFTVDTVSGEVQAKTQELLNLQHCTTNCAGVGTPVYVADYPADPAVTSIVAAAVANAATLGAAPLGQIGGPFFRAKLANGTTENRGAESTLGNLVAEVQRWNTRLEDQGAAQIAFMNPGGLRTDMVGTGTGDFPRTLTYKQAADVQPFANTLVNMDLTGAQIKLVLEQQWQPVGAARPFLKLGISKGFTYTSDDSKPEGSRITGMWLDGDPIDLGTTYSVTVNSFLAAGGDNFFELANGTGKQDTGKVDLEGMVDYMATFGSGSDVVPVDYKQASVDVTFAPGEPAVYSDGDHVKFDVTGWSMTNSADVKDVNVAVKIGTTTLGTFALTNTAQAALPGFDVTGQATVDAVLDLPPGTPAGPLTLTLVGAATGTSIDVPITVSETEPATRDIQILGTNDFHGRLVREGGSPTAGAAVLSGAVKQLRAANPDTAFVAAGDLIGASTFESFIAQDVPTIDSLNEAGLDVSAAGNHEFDKGYDDLVDRVEPLADWEYIAANIRNNGDNTHALAPTWTQNFGSVKVGYVGAVTEDLPELVSPAGISEIHVTDIVTEVNAAANDLEADGADLIVLLVHEGAPGTNCATMDDAPLTEFGSIITGVNDKIDAIVSGHTHLAYDCAFDVPGWSGRDVTERPVVSAGQYGMALNKLVFTIDTETGEVQAKTQELLNLQHCTTNCAGVGTPVYVADYPADPAVTAIVTAAVNNAAVLGAQPLGNIGGPFFRAKLANGSTENRGAESTLGNLVAEVQRWNTRMPDQGAAQIAFMNPGGLRTDMVGTGAGPFPRVLTYKQAADVQPFANTLVNMDLTGAQIKLVLEQQWQPVGAARPFLKLGISKGFTYTSDDSKPQGSRITGMWLDGNPVGLGATYSVTVNSFLAAGGDNFFELANGTGKQDTGKVDLEGMVDYMATFGSGSDVVPVDYKQASVDVTFAPGEPAVYDAGDHVKFDVTGWSMTNSADVKDTSVVVKLGATTLGTFPLTNTAQAALPGFDITGQATVDVVLPAGTGGATTLTLTGATTGTTSSVKIAVREVPVITATPNPATVLTLSGVSNIAVTVASAAAGDATGTVTASINGTVVDTDTLSGGAATLTVGPFSTEGARTVTIAYSGDPGTADGSTTTTVTAVKSAGGTTISASAPPMAYGTPGSVIATVSPAGGSGTVTVKKGATVIATGPLNPNGQATIVIPGTALLPGSHSLTVSYGGDPTHSPSSTTTTLVVNKGVANITATPNPATVKVKSGTSNVAITVTSPAGTPTGTVRAVWNGTILDSASLSSGSATLQVSGFPTTGAKTVVIQYLGNTLVAAAQKNITITVVP